MLITKHFVMLNYPKTGSSFSRHCIKTILDAREKRRTRLEKWIRDLTGQFDYVELFLPNIKTSSIERPVDQHGCYCQIPDQYRYRKVISVGRDPVKRLISTYQFEGWKRWVLVPEEIILEDYPSFPNLTIEEYASYQHKAMIYGRLGGKAPRADVGDQTIQFIQMFFKQPDEVISAITDNYLDSNQFIQDMAPVSFLRQENLANELIKFLAPLGYTDSELDLIRHMPKINVTSSRNPASYESMSQSLIEQIRYRERLLYRIYDHLGIHY